MDTAIGGPLGRILGILEPSSRGHRPPASARARSVITAAVRRVPCPGPWSTSA